MSVMPHFHFNVGHQVTKNDVIRAGERCRHIPRIVRQAARQLDIRQDSDCTPVDLGARRLIPVSWVDVVVVLGFGNSLR
jgi:hypothetical protein